MFGTGWLNLGSLALGLIAWTFPIINLMRRDKSRHGNWIIFCVISLSACALSLCMQIFYSDHLVKIEDWSALMDTSHVVALISILLLGVTIILNTVTLIVYKKTLKD
jgi:cytochrome c oxidase subunit 4